MGVDGSRVALPNDAEGAVEVYVNGLRQREGTDFERRDGELVFCDEALTPDSSRFWPADSYQPGHAQPSFDKQFVRDWLEQSGWDKTPPAPLLPPDVIEATSAKYIQAYELITGRTFEPEGKA